MFRPASSRRNVRGDARVLDQHPGVETRHDRLVQTAAVNPADAAYSDVCIPTAVTLFPWE